MYKYYIIKNRYIIIKYSIKYPINFYWNYYVKTLFFSIKINYFSKLGNWKLLCIKLI